MIIKLPRIVKFSESDCRSICLYQILRYFNCEVSLQEINKSCKKSAKFRDWDYYLGCYALKKGLKAKVHTRSLTLFDSTWFSLPSSSLIKKLRKKLKNLETLTLNYPGFKKFALESESAIEFLEEKGEISFEAFSKSLISRYLSLSLPLIVTFTGQLVYAMPKEKQGTPNDIEGDPWKHSVILVGQDRKSYQVLDPSKIIKKTSYNINKDLLLDGIIRYDSNILAVYPRNQSP